MGFESSLIYLLFSSTDEIIIIHFSSFLDPRRFDYSPPIGYKEFSHSSSCRCLFELHEHNEVGNCCGNHGGQGGSVHWKHSVPGLLLLLLYWKLPTYHLPWHRLHPVHHPPQLLDTVSVLVGKIFHRLTDVEKTVIDILKSGEESLHVDQQNWKRKVKLWIRYIQQIGAVSILYNHFLWCFTPLGG